MNTIENLLDNPRAYWQNRYDQYETPWDMGSVSPPLKAYFDTIADKNLRILIPGCGNGYEADYLMQQGFTNVTMLDIAAAPVERLKSALAPFLGNSLRVIEGDFFSHTDHYDLIIEQTFFCALPPVLREKYAEKVRDLLYDKSSRLAGLLFDAELNADHPPFGSHADQYRQLLVPHLKIYLMERANNSHKARLGRELFVLLGK